MKIQLRVNGEARVADVPPKSCTLFAVQADGTDVTRIEGMGQLERLHSVNRPGHLA